LPQHSSAAKKERRDKRFGIRNKMIKSRLKTEIKKIRNVLENKETKDLEPQLKKSISLIDKTKTKGVIHSNKAARLKSRLTKKANGLIAKA
jgi:small subunit ribosomal protein S20